MKIAVFGAGAIGSFYASRLIQAGEDVVIIARGRTSAALKEHGLRIHSPKADITIDSINVAEDPAEIGPVDLVLVAVKSWQVPDVAHATKPLIGSNTAVLPLQNGVEAANHLATVLGVQHVLNGTTKVIVCAPEPGRIEDMGFDPLIAAGELEGRPSSRLTEIQKVFEAAGVTFELPADIEITVWDKFLFIASVSGVGAITRSSIGVLRKLPQTRTLLEESMAEIYRVGRAKGVRLSEDIVDKTMQFADSLPADSTASLQRDIMAGRPSELESQNGAVVRFGNDCGVDTPLNRYIYYSLLPMERRARGI